MFLDRILTAGNFISRESNHH